MAKFTEDFQQEISPEEMQREDERKRLEEMLTQVQPPIQPPLAPQQQEIPMAPQEQEPMVESPIQPIEPEVIPQTSDNLGELRQQDEEVMKQQEIEKAKIEDVKQVTKDVEEGKEVSENRLEKIKTSIDEVKQQQKEEKKVQKEILKTPEQKKEEKVDKIQDKASDNIIKKEQPADKLEKMLEESRKLRSDRDKSLTRASWLEFAATMGQSLAQYGANMGTAEAGAAGGVVLKPTDLKLKAPKVYETVQKNYENKLAGLMSDYKLMKAIDEKAAESEKADPNSAVSKNILGVLSSQGVDVSKLKGKSYNDIKPYAQQMLSNAFNKNKKDAMTTYQQESLMLRKKELAFKETGEERREKAFGTRVKQDIKNTILKQKKDFMKDDTIKSFRAQGIAFDQMDDLRQSIEEGNEVALGAIGTKAARAMGEVGVLTDQDVKRYIQGQSLVRQAKDKFGRAWQGKVSQATLDDIKNIVGKMRSGFDQKVKPIITNYAETTYENLKDFGLSREEVYNRLKLGIPERGIEGKSSEQPTMKQDSKIADYAKQYNLDYEKAKQILEKRGYRSK